LLAVGYCYTLALDLGMQVNYFAFCLILPLVGLVRLLPVSLNGIGLGEGAFVLLLGLFGVPQGQALAFALVMLGLQTAMASLGGLLLVIAPRTAGRPEAAVLPVAQPPEPGRALAA
jgi:hypothetical protein